MNTFKMFMTNIFGLTTMGLLVYGTYKIIKTGVYEIPELTFLMFTTFVLTSLFGISNK